MRSLLRKGLVFFLAFWMGLLGFIPSESSAMLFPSSLTAIERHSSASHEKDLAQIQVLLESKLVIQRLEDLGFTPDEIQDRVSQLSDTQIHYFAQRLDSLQTGGDALGIVIALLVVAILVFILLQITGHKVIVTK